MLSRATTRRTHPVRAPETPNRNLKMCFRAFFTCGGFPSMWCHATPLQPASWGERRPLMACRKWYLRVLFIFKFRFPVPGFGFGVGEDRCLAALPAARLQITIPPFPGCGLRVTGARCLAAPPAHRSETTSQRAPRSLISRGRILQYGHCPASGRRPAGPGRNGCC
jgi:hypothetical protein